MIPPINLRGFTRPDPLDRASGTMQFVLTGIVTLAIALAFNYIQSGPLAIITFQYPWMWMAGSLVMAFLMTPVLVMFRKSSSLFFYAIIVSISFLTELYLQAHFRDRGLTAMWMYNPGNFISDITILPLRFLVAWSFDGFIMGALCLWVTRLIAGVLYPASKAAPEPTTDQQKALFPDDWTNEPVAKPKHDAPYVILRILGFAYLTYLIYLVLGVIGSSPWPAAINSLLVMAYRNPALAIDTYSKISLMILLAFIGAYNREVRWYTTLLMLIGHSVSTISSLAFYFFVQLGTTPEQINDHNFLLTSAIVDGVMVLLFIYILIRSRADSDKFMRTKEFPASFSLGAKLTTILYYVIGVVMLVFIPFALYCRFMMPDNAGMGAVFNGPDPMLGNLLTMCGTMASLAFFMAQNKKLQDYLAGVLIFGFSIVAFVTIPWLMFGSIAIFTRSFDIVEYYPYFVIHAFVDGLAASLIIALRKLSYNLDYTITDINPSSAKNIMALQEAFHGGTPEESAAILQLIDRYVSDIRGRKRGLLSMPFWIVEQVFPFVFGVHPVFSTMTADERRYFLRKYMLRLPLERQRSFAPPIAELSYKIGIAVNAMTTFANYSHINNRTEVGYVPIDARDRLQGDYATSPPPFKAVAPMPRDHKDPANFKPQPPPNAPALVAPRVSTALVEPDIPDELDYMIIGSGAGGAVMAYRLACEAKDPSRIMLVEQGARYSPLQDFNDHEMEMMPKLYKEGGLQQTKKFDMIVLQGECLGGTTVINNAVCFKMPDKIRALWQNNYDLDLSNIDAEYDRVAEEIGIAPLTDDSINVNAKQRFIKAIDNYGKKNPPFNRDIPLNVNYRNILGEETWNIGNKRLRKRSMLETYIPWAEARGVRIVSNTNAVRFTGNTTADSVLLQTGIGELRTVKVRKAVIVSGGVIASSHFLMRSGVMKNVGQRMSCNFAFPAAFQFPDVIDAFDGTQITLGASDPNDRAVFETYFNPPGAFALSIPFFFDRHRSVMTNYRNLLNFGALVGSEPNGTIEVKSSMINGRSFDWTLGQTDKENIRYALGTLLDIGYEAGATRAIMPTQPGIDIQLTPENIDRFKKAIAQYPLRNEDLQLATAHPQGGNIMVGEDSPFSAMRALDSHFLVDGYSNVYVADASIFPTSITLNPQWTIMALSSMAAKEVLKNSL